MKRKSCFIIMLTLLVGVFIGCSNNPQLRSNPQQEKKSSELRQVEEIQDFSTINGYKIQEGKFFFTGVKNHEWDFYSFDLETENINSIHQEAENYDLYIALGETGGVYIDLEGKLFYKIKGKEKKIDEEVMGTHRPNLLISPNQNAVLYTKGPQEEADLYIYFFQQDKPLLVKENIPEDAFATFSFTTQWSNKNNYFIYNNEEIYNDKGELQVKIEATTAKWSPEDDHVVFIKKPNDLQHQKIIIGDWSTYIGEELVLLSLRDKTEERIYKSPLGLIDPIDNIQWSKDASKVSVSVGDIKKSPHGELERVEYEKVFVYDVSTKEGVEVEDMPYNYYEILFDNYLYGSSLGKRDILEIVSIYHQERKRYETPVLLNSQDMFLISHKEEGYFLDDRKLIKITSAGETEIMIEFPWEVNEIYLDPKTKSFIITNREMEMYLLRE